MYLHLTAATDISYMLVWVLWNNGSDAFSTFLTSHRSEIQSLDHSSHQKRQLNVPLHWKLAGKQLLYSKLKNRLSLDINWVGENNEFNKLKSDYSEIFAQFLKQFNKNFNNFQTFAPGRNPGWPSFITYKEISSIGRVVQRGPLYKEDLMADPRKPKSGTKRSRSYYSNKLPTQLSSTNHNKGTCYIYR